MIPIIINNKRYKIKSISELTTLEFIELSKIDNLDYVKYISWQTKLSMNDCFFAVTDKAVEVGIGYVPDIIHMPRLKLSYVDYNKTISTVGQRHQVETCGLSGYELLVFCLAVAQAHSVNIDDVHQLRDIYMDEPWQEIFPAGFFFFKIYSRGNKSEQSILKRLLNLIKTPS